MMMLIQEINTDNHIAYEFDRYVGLNEKSNDQEQEAHHRLVDRKCAFYFWACLLRFVAEINATKRRYFALSKGIELLIFGMDILHDHGYETKNC